MQACGGTKPGIVVGENDDHGYNITEDPIHVHDLQATIPANRGGKAWFHERTKAPRSGHRQRQASISKSAP